MAERGRTKQRGLLLLHVKRKVSWVFPTSLSEPRKSKWRKSCRGIVVGIDSCQVVAVISWAMSRSVRDLRELINVSRLSYRDEDEVDDLCYESAQDFGGMPLEVSQPSLLKRKNKDLAPLSSKGKPVSPPLSSGSSGRGSPLPPIGASNSPSTNNSPSSSGRNSPVALDGDQVISARQ